MVEFLLVFLVLFVAARGFLVLYKNVWSARYNKTGIFSGKAAAAAKIGGAGDVDAPVIGTIKTDYVK